jgi:protein-disulfide isomerase
MKRKYSWLLVLLVVTMLVAACGPDMATPTPAAKPEEEVETQPTAPAEESQEATAPTEESQEATAPAGGELPVDADDWHALGSADAPVTVIEYSDFQ